MGFWYENKDDTNYVSVEPAKYSEGLEFAVGNWCEDGRGTLPYDQVVKLIAALTEWVNNNDK